MTRWGLVVIGFLWVACPGHVAGEPAVAPETQEAFPQKMASLPVGRIQGPSAVFNHLPAVSKIRPPEALPLARSLDQVVELFEARDALARQLRQLRIQQDSAKTTLMALASERELITAQRQQLTERLANTAQQQGEQFGRLQETLEARVQEELSQAGEQVTQALQQDLGRERRLFETRRRDAIERDLDRQLDLEVRELQQLAQEIDVQMRELFYNLERLDANVEAAEWLERSMRQALRRRQGQLLARRQQLERALEASLRTQWDALLDNLTQQHEAEHHRRMTMKEIALRRAMADLLHRTHTRAVGERAHLQQVLEDLEDRSRELTDREAQRLVHVQALEHDVASQIERTGALESAWDEAMTRVEQVLERGDLITHPGVMEWFDHTIQQLRIEVGSTLRLLSQRVLARTRHGRRFDEQREVLRDRQVTLQLARAMEQQREDVRITQRQEDESKARQTDEGLAKAEQLAGRGAYEEALGIIAEIQSLDPPQIARVMLAREEVLATQASALRQIRADDLTQQVAHAMEVFDQGRFEEAGALFAQVLASEVASEHPAQLLAGIAP